MYHLSMLLLGLCGHHRWLNCSMTLSQIPNLIWSRECLKSSSKGGDTFTSSIRIGISISISIEYWYRSQKPWCFRQSIGIEHTKNRDESVDNSGNVDEVVIVVVSLLLLTQSILVTAVFKWKETRLDFSKSLTKAFHIDE